MRELVRNVVYMQLKCDYMQVKQIDQLRMYPTPPNGKPSLLHLVLYLTGPDSRTWAGVCCRFAPVSIDRDARVALSGISGNLGEEGPARLCSSGSGDDELSTPGVLSM